MNVKAAARPARAAAKTPRTKAAVPAAEKVQKTEATNPEGEKPAKAAAPMEALKLVLKGGREVEIDVPAASGEKDYAIFVLGVRKSGSTLLNKIWTKSARRMSMPFVDIGGGLFKKDVRAGQWADDPGIASAFKPGYVYGGFRSAYLHFEQSPVYKSAKKVLLVRDPRDALVSQYFSTLKTHSLPPESSGPGGASDQLLRQREAAQGMSVDDYVLMNARSFRRTLQEYVPLLDDPELQVFRYEDIILDKGPWIHKMLKHTGLPAPKNFIEHLTNEFNVVPTVENPNQFVRKVTPGDHREKLKKPTIEALNLIFGDVAAHFGYKFR